MNEHQYIGLVDKSLFQDGVCVLTDNKEVSTVALGLAVACASQGYGLRSEELRRIAEQSHNIYVEQTQKKLEIETQKKGFLEKMKEFSSQLELLRTQLEKGLSHAELTKTQLMIIDLRSNLNQEITKYEQ